MVLTLLHGANPALATMHDITVLTIDIDKRFITTLTTEGHAASTNHKQSKLMELHGSKLFSYGLFLHCHVPSHDWSPGNPLLCMDPESHDLDEVADYHQMSESLKNGDILINERKIILENCLCKM